MKFSTMLKKFRARFQFWAAKSSRERKLGRKTAKYIFDLRDNAEDELIAAERLGNKNLIEIAKGRIDILDKVISHGEPNK